MKIGTNEPKNSLDLIRMICKSQMNLQDDHVSIYDQKWVIPPYDDLFLVVEYRNGKTLMNRNYFDNSTGTPQEVQTVNMLENIVVGVFSRNNEALWRKEEVFMALASSYAQFIQEQYAFKIARCGTIQDLSSLEGTASLKRYDIEIQSYAWYEKIISPNYINPPFTLQVIANDLGNGEIKQNVTQFTTVPIL